MLILTRKANEKLFFYLDEEENTRVEVKIIDLKVNDHVRLGIKAHSRVSILRDNAKKILGGVKI